MSTHDDKPTLTPEIGGPRTFTTPETIYRRPEWQGVVDAIGRFVEALPDDERAQVKRVELIDAVDNVVRTLPYGDSCEACVRAGDYTVCYPHAATITGKDGSGMQAQYQCPTCEYEWSVGYSVDYPLVMSGHL